MASFKTDITWDPEGGVKRIEEPTLSPEEEARLVEEEQKAKESRSLGALLEDDKFSVIESYMSDRFGMSSQDYDKQEIVDSFVNQMRSFNAGNSVTVATELSHLYSGKSDEEMDNRRRTATEAYQLFDSLGGAFGSDRTLGEKADAVYDYGKALIADPVNLVSLGVGKLAAKGATTGVKQAITRMATEAGEAAVRNLPKNASQAAKTEARNRAVQLATRRAMQDQGAREAGSLAVRREILGATAADATAAGVVDIAQQKAELEAGYRDNYSPLQTGFSLGGGLVAGGAALVLNKMKGTNQLPSLALEVERSMSVLDAAKTLREGAAIEEGIDEIDQGALASILSKDVGKLRSIKESIEKGREAATIMESPLAKVQYDMSIARSFLLGDPDQGVKGLIPTFVEAGLRPRKIDDGTGNKTYIAYFNKVIQRLNPEIRRQAEDALGTVVKGTDLDGTTLDDFANMTFAEISDGARATRFARTVAEAAKASGKKIDDVTAGDILGEVLPQTVSDEVKPFVLGEGIKNFQSNFIRLLVTHPGTTALNLIGWKTASQTQVASDMMRATLYGGTAMLKALMGSTTSAKKYANMSRQMVSLQKQKLRNLVDPFSTYEDMMEYLVYRPQARKELFRYMQGGVEVDNILKELDLKPGETLNKSTLEKTREAFEVAYGVRAQDFFTKTQEFAYALDKQIRLKYNMSYAEFLQKDDLAEIMTDKTTASYKEFLEVEAAAVKDALRNTFALSYGDKASGPISFVAQIIEKARTVPIVGAMVPFGQFFNNTVAFMLDHVGISAIHQVGLRVLGGEASRDMWELSSKTAVGMTLAGAYTASELSNLEAGLAWNQERNERGAVQNRAYDFPLSLYKMVGRMGAHIVKDGEIPEGLIEDFVSNFGLTGLTRGLDDATKVLLEAGRSLARGETDQVGKAVKESLAASASMYISGATRRLDPINQVMAVYRGEEFEAIDRKQGYRWVNESTRYVDQIFEAISGKQPGEALGGKRAEEKRVPTSDREGVAQIGRIVGYREVQPQSTIQRLFNDVGRPQWMTNIQIKSPEAANAFNEFVYPTLEVYADVLVSSGKWQGMDLEKRQEALQNILTLARRDAKELLSESIGDEDEKISLILEANDSGVSKRALKRIYDQLGVSEDRLWELNLPQLRLLNYFIDEEREGKTSRRKGVSFFE